MRSTSADVIIVGGGFMGASAAFFLRRRDRSVVLLERDLVGQQASGVNFGNVRRQGRFLPQLPLANRSRDIWGNLTDLIGDDVEFLPTGHLRLGYREEDVAVLERYAADAQQYGLELELLGRSALRERFPFVGPEAIAASFSPHDGHANPRLAAPAFARAASHAGAQVFERTEVLSIEKASEDFVVESSDGQTFRAPVVLVTAGVWGGQLSQQFDEPVPIVAMGPQMAVTEPVPYALGPVVGICSSIPEEVVYLRQVKRGNIVYGGGPRGPVFPDLRRSYVLPSNTLRQFEEVQRLVPALAKLRVIRTWSGIEGYLRDDIPIMGESTLVSGLYYAFGFCGHGFQLGPGVGDVMAELIDRGRTETPIDPFHIGRFSVPPAPANEISTDIETRRLA